MNETAVERPRNLYTGILLLLIILALFVLLVVVRSRQPAPNLNQLNLGGQTPDQAYPIRLQVPIELDGLPRSDVWRIRTEAVNQYPYLIIGSYAPSMEVFGQIEDGLPWWGMSGQFYFGSGEKSIRGPAEESRFVINPYLLVAADFFGLGQEATPGWNTSMIQESFVESPNFPLICQPNNLSWNPQRRYAEVSYNVSQCMREMSYWATSPLTLPYMTFDLIAYNARDFNLNFMQVSFIDSPNLSQYEPFRGVFPISHFIHRGGSCGYPGGCNNMSPTTPEISYYTLAALPAHMTIWLWKNNPGTSSIPPDMRFVIRFQ